MNQTEQFQLNQWEKSDRIMMEDFNADNAKTEQVLADHSATLAEQAALIAKCGNCKIVCGSYTGSGHYGNNSKNTLSFDHKPMLVFVQEKNYVDSSVDYHLRMVRDSVWSNGKADNYRFAQTVSWGDKSVSWYSASGTNAEMQFNKSSAVYTYVALLAADE